MKLNLDKISPTDLRDFVKASGWQLLQEALDDGIYVLSNPAYPKRQIVFPINSDVPDYFDSIERAIAKLSEISNQSMATMLSNLMESKDDTVRFRVVDARNEDSFIPLSYAANAINGAKELFLSAACSVLKPQVHHPRLSRAEAWKLLAGARFRHTERGSFILKVSSPVKALEIQGRLFNEDIPFARQAALTINKGLSGLISAIEADRLTEFVDGVKKDKTPALSSNLCKAISNFKDDRDDFDLFVDFHWATAYPVTAGIPVKPVIKIQKDYFSRIEEVRRELRDINEQKDKHEIFMATVEHLAGDINDGGARSGEVILHLYHGEDEVIRARTNLSSDRYKMADEAHMTVGAYIRIKGILHPGNQPRELTDVTLFELLRP